MYYEMDSIMGRPPVLNPKQTTTSIRLSTDEKLFVEEQARKAGYSSITDYLRSLVFQDKQVIEKEISKVPSNSTPVTKFHSTEYGTMWNGNSLTWMQSQPDSSVNLIMTSPPFGLVRKNHMVMKMLMITVIGLDHLRSNLKEF